MSSTKSVSINDATDMDSTYDRYSVNHTSIESRDGDESNRHPLSVTSESSFGSGTYGTGTYVSDGLETLERDDYYDEFDNLSLDSQPMVIDHFVDSACSCLDTPVGLYQSMCSKHETSLLQQSKSRSRPTIVQNTSTATNLDISGAKRRSIHHRSAALPKNIDQKGDMSSMGEEKKHEMKLMRIQPNEELEVKVQPNEELEVNDVGDSDRQASDSQAEHEEENGTKPDDDDQELVAPDPMGNDNTSPLEAASMNDNSSEESDEKIEQKKTSEEEAQNTSNPDAKSKLVGANVVEEVEERDTNAHITETEDADLKIDPPSDEEIAATREGQPADSYPANQPSQEPPASDKHSGSAAKNNEKSIAVAKDPSGRDQRYASPTLMKSMSTQEASPKSNEEAPSLEGEIADNNDEKSLSNSVEIVDVLSIDDQDSWIPGSTSKVGDSRPQDIQNSSQPNVHSTTSILLSRSKTQDQKDERPVTATSSIVNELWIEEEAKLKNKTSLSRTASFTSKGLAPAQSAEDLWNEERMKLQITESKVREVLMGQRRSRLQDAMVDARRSQDRIQKALEGRERDYFSTSKSLGRNRPSPELYSAIQRSLSSKRTPLQRGNGESLNVAPLPSRENDLVAVRSIEEGQRIRSSNRDAIVYNSTSHPKQSGNTNLDVHRQIGKSSSRSPYDEHSKLSHRQPKATARRSSRSKDLIGRKGLVEDPIRMFQLNDNRDDQESLPSVHHVESRPVAAPPIGKNRSGYENAYLASKELRKLEKKIEKQLRKADLDSKMDQSKERRKMEKKLSNKLKSIKADHKDAQAMTSREIKRLERHLEQTLSIENENRSSKLMKIKRKELSSVRPRAPSRDGQEFVQVHSSYSGQADLEQLLGYGSTDRSPGRPLPKERKHNRSDGSRIEKSRGLRSRFLRLGRRSYASVPETD